MLHYSDEGSGDTIVFLHGIAGSLNYWQQYAAALKNSHRIIRIDLLGYGQSPEAKSTYSTKTHCQAIKQLLDQLGVTDNVVLVGHSMGALLALSYAKQYPRGITYVLLLGMPIFKNAAEARRDITKSKKSLDLLYYGTTSRVLCTIWCYRLRPITKRLAPLYLPHFPKQVAIDSVFHTWKSYSESLHNVIENQAVGNDLRSLKIPVDLMYGDNESKVVLNNARALTLSKNARLTFISGDHNFPLSQVEAICERITQHR